MSKIFLLKSINFKRCFLTEFGDVSVKFKLVSIVFTTNFTLLEQRINLLVTFKLNVLSSTKLQTSDFVVKKINYL